MQDPEAVILLPFLPDAYQLEDSPFPNKSALKVTAWKALEDVVELVMQLAYVLTFQEAGSFIWVNLGEWCYTYAHNESGVRKHRRHLLTSFTPYRFYI